MSAKTRFLVLLGLPTLTFILLGSFYGLMWGAPVKNLQIPACAALAGCILGCLGYIRDMVLGKIGWRYHIVCAAVTSAALAFQAIVRGVWTQPADAFDAASALVALAFCMAASGFACHYIESAFASEEMFEP